MKTNPFSFLEVCRQALVGVRVAQMRLDQLCPIYVAGALPSYEPVSRAAYLLGYEVKTLAQTLDWMMYSSPTSVQHLYECAHIFLDRAKELERLFVSGSLLRSHVYFDDVLELDALDEDIILAPRQGISMGQVGQTVPPDMSSGGEL